MEKLSPRRALTGPTSRSGTAGTDPQVQEKRCDREVRISVKLGEMASALSTWCWKHLKASGAQSWRTTPLHLAPSLLEPGKGLTACNGRD